MFFEGKAQAFPFFLERVYALRAKGCGMRIGMGCKAQTTDIAVAMARICNAADRPRPRLHTREEIVNTFLKPLATPCGLCAKKPSPCSQGLFYLW